MSQNQRSWSRWWWQQTAIKCWASTWSVQKLPRSSRYAWQSVILDQKLEVYVKELTDLCIDKLHMLTRVWISKGLYIGRIFIGLCLPAGLCCHAEGWHYQESAG